MPKRKKEPSPQDFRFLEQVRGLMGMANRALEEAAQYAEVIQDPELKAQAQRLLEQ